ncbi:hypothetical protein [Paenarthrobacter sp. DKR-5]|uniref:hypothetical protein n=1 Tax=Paenarthrobacter sp. DKR-5 TaxID=2835535 RepID=UPI0020278995|nr:hypothetical protein [Paenarthrobacter sp. DKR-5]
MTGAAASSSAALPTQVLTGTGDAVKHLSLQGNKALITFECGTCTGNTILRTNGFDTLLVNVIGPYSGTHLVDTDGTSSTSVLTVTADSPWKITVSDPALLPPSAGPVSGRGDQVIHLTGTSTEAFVTNKGRAAFAVVGIGGPMKDLAVDDVGSYKGVVPLQAPEYVQIESDGTWTLSPQ